MRFPALILVAVVSIFLGAFGHKLLDIGSLLNQSGYWIVGALFVSWFYLAMATIRDQLRNIWSGLGWTGLAWVLLAGLFLISREPTEFKIVMDEPMLVAISQGMHVQRSSTMPVRSYTVAGVKEYWGGFQDKRPLLFPLILSLVHDATGYRVENVFWLNKAVIFALLILAWQLGRRLDPKFGGEMMLLWLCGWPILAQNACGGGFEILNLALIMVVFAAAWHYLWHSDFHTEAFLLCSCLLLAHTRYESVLYLVVFVGIWLVRSIVNHRWSLSWFTVVSPIFLIPILWQREIVTANSGEVAWEFRQGVDHAFGFDFIRSNIEHAIKFFMVPNAELAGSPLLGAMGLLALFGLGIFVLLRIWRKEEVAPKIKALCWVVSGVALGFGVLLSYHWGQLDDPVVSRLALPLVGVMGLAICAIRPLLLPTNQMGRLIVAVFALWILGYVLPVMNQHRYSQNNIHTTIFRWAREEITKSGAKSPLVISYQERLWSIYGTSALSLKEAANRLPQIELHRSLQTFDQVFLVRSFIDDSITREIIPLKGNRFVDGVELETVAEKSFYPFNLVRISKVKAINLDRATKDKATPEQFEVFRNASPEDMKTWRDMLP